MKLLSTSLGVLTMAVKCSAESTESVTVPDRSGQELPSILPSVRKGNDGKFGELPPNFFDSMNVRKYLNPNLFKDPSVMDTISDQLVDGRVVVIRNAFHPDFAEAAYRDLDNAQFSVEQEYHASGSHHSFHQLDTDLLRQSAVLNSTFLILNSNETKRYMSDLSGRDCMGEITARAEYYRPGDHSLPTPDFLDQRTIAFEWHLTKNWAHEWGGALYWCQETRAWSFIHASFNTLVLYSVSHDTSHFVTPVKHEATEKRLSLTGWLNSAWIPKHDDNYEEILTTWRENMTAFQYMEIDVVTNSEAFDQDKREKLEPLLWDARHTQERSHHGTYVFGEDDVETHYDEDDEDDEDNEETHHDDYDDHDDHDEDEEETDHDEGEDDEEEGEEWENEF